MLNHALLLLVVLMLSGCMATSANRVKDVQPGMSRAQVVNILGDPVSYEAQDNRELMIFNLRETYYLQGQYAVVFEDRKVQSFGRVADSEKSKKVSLDKDFNFES